MKGSGRLQIDIGIDAPLDPSGRERPLAEAHRISARWIAGALLTGMAGAAMIGGAIMATLQSETPATVAALAQQSAPSSGPATRSLTGSSPSAAERQDRMIKPVDIALARRSFEAQAMVKSGDREIVQSRRYTRVSAPLEAYGSSGRNLPRFNPMVLISEANANRSFSSVTMREDPNADVSISTTDLTPVAAANPAFALDDDAAAAQAEEAMLATGGASVSDSPLTMLERVMNADEDQQGSAAIAFTPLPGSPFAKLEVRLVPENFAEMAKLGEDEISMLHREAVTTIGKDGSVEEAIGALEVDARVARAAEKALVAAVGKDGISSGARLKLRFAQALGQSGRSEDLVNVTLYKDDQIAAQIGRADDGSFAATPMAEPPKVAEDEKGDRLTVFASIYETALRQDVPRPLVDELVRVYSYDVDFQRPVSPSDSIDFLYAEPEPGAEEQGELLKVAISLGGDTKSYYRFQSPDDNSVDFYDPKAARAANSCCACRCPLASFARGSAGAAIRSLAI